MKKLLIVLLSVFLSFPLFSQEPEGELSDYEKYRMEQEAKLYPEDDDFLCWDAVEEMPKFNGGEASEFQKWILLNVEYPVQARDEKIQGKVFVEFVVNKYGDVERVKVRKSVDPILDAEAIRVVQTSPKWSPGFQNGTPVNVQFTFPINFKLKDEPIEVPVVVNNYYDYDYDFGYRSRLYFDTWYYRPYTHYSYYDPFYYNNYWGYNPYYYGGYYSYWGYNSYYPMYYGYNHYYPYHTHYYPKTYGGKYYATSSLGRSQRYSPYYKTYSSGYVNRPTTTTKSVATRPQPNRQVTTRTSPTKSTYTPRYNKPRATTSQSYNRPMKTTRVTPTTSQSRTTYNRPSSTSRSSTSYSRPSSTSSSTYSRSSAPSRSSSSYSRSSSPSSSRSYSGSSSSRGSASRSSGRR